jgi:DNA-directed RNA polymerase specialized sigma24 family protein
VSEPDEFPAGPVARELVRHKAIAMTRRAGLPPGDRADLEQELLVRLVAAMRGYDPARGRPNTFAAAVVDRAAAGIAREAAASKRGGGQPRPASLDDPSTPHPAAPADPDRADLALDVADVLKRLPDDLRALADRLSDLSAAEAARDAGVARSTFLRRVTRLRRHFEDAGLEVYSKSVRHFPDVLRRR